MALIKIEKVPEYIIDIIIGFLLLLSVLFTNPAIFNSLFPQHVIFNAWAQNIFFVILTIVFGFYVSYLYKEHSDFFRSIFKLDILYWKTLKQELSFVVKSRSKINRKQLSEILRSSKGILKPDNRIRFDYEHICVESTIKASKLMGQKEFRLRIATDISEQFNKVDFDYMLSSETTANKSLSSTLAEKFDNKPHYFYRLSIDGKINLNMSQDFNPLKTEEKDEINILIVEATMLTPQVLHKLIGLINEVADCTDKTIKVNGLCIIFNAYDKIKTFKDLTHKKFINIFELNQKMLPSSDCVGCFLNKCAMVRSVEKSYILPYPNMEGG